MRSSIACVRCRKSKVKCVNTGPNTTCRACESASRECTYPQQVQGGQPRGSTGGAAGISGYAAGSGGGSHGLAGGYERADQAPKKPKPKKPSGSGNAPSSAASLNTPKAWKECLENAVLNQNVWQQLFEVFQAYYSPLLPFLHPPSFLRRIRSSSVTGSSGTSPPAPEKPHSPLLLLGLLALTARHNQALVAHHTPALANAAAVSDFYASALKFRLKGDGDDNFMAGSLEKVQALLMLTMHEWGQGRKQEAFTWLGIAIRMSAALELSWVDHGSASVATESDDERSGKRRKLDNGTSQSFASAANNDDFVHKEIKRRTFWGLFMMDRALSGERRFPSVLGMEDAGRVLLPCGEQGFLFGEAPRTGYLTNPDNARNGEAGGCDAEEKMILARVIRAMDIWGRVSSWAEGGQERLSPNPERWDEILAELDSFVAALPRQHQYSQQTLSVHMSSRTASPYAVLHLVIFLAYIRLYRSILPDVAFRALSPGDLTPITADGEVFVSAVGKMFACACDLVVLVHALEDWGTHVESPLVIEALYQAARTGIYAHSFPLLDTAGILTGWTPSGSTASSNGEEPRKAIEFILKLKTRWPMAETAITGLGSLCRSIMTKKEDVLKDPNEPSELKERITRELPHHEEKRRLFALVCPPKTPRSVVAPPEPKQTAHKTPRNSGSASGSDLEALTQTANNKPAADGWMAVNTTPTTVLPKVSSPQQAPLHRAGPVYTPHATPREQINVPVSAPSPLSQPMEYGVTGDRSLPRTSDYLHSLAGFAAKQPRELGTGSDDGLSRDVKMEEFTSGGVGVPNESGKEDSSPGGHGGVSKPWINQGPTQAGGWGMVPSMEG